MFRISFVDATGPPQTSSLPCLETAAGCLRPGLSLRTLWWDLVPPNPCSWHVFSPERAVSLTNYPLSGISLSNCEVFSAQPGLCREQEETKWELFQIRFTFLPLAFAKQLEKMPAREPALSFSNENGWALCSHNKPNWPGGFTGVNYVVEVKYILWTKAMIDGFFIQKTSAHLRFNHF